MSDTPNLKLPYIEAAQAQKHVTHNEALRALDAIVQLGILNRDLASTPASPADGDRYLVATGASGDWSGNENQIAVWQDGDWTFLEPRPGWLCWVIDEDVLTIWNGTAWQDVDIAIPDALQNKTMIGVRSDAVLFSHDGSGIQAKLNKNAVGDTASFLFQTGWSGRAEIGLAGDDDFAFKVSADGSAWNTAFVLGSADGVARFAQPLELKQYSRSSLP
ncbi:MAG TPA: DUF2793 domain-containing protein, partial [Methylothermaceae bacterium]|nr:DUF2793 domain-containing protein [Methylothermaceae bacterium]